MKLYQKLELLSYRLRYEATYQAMKYHLKRVVKGKEDDYLKRIGHYDRNIGKSCALARLSVKYNIPVVVPTRSWESLYTRDIPNYIPKYFKKKRPQVIVANENAKGKRYDYILLEERVARKIFDTVITPMIKKGYVGYNNVDIME